MAYLAADKTKPDKADEPDDTPRYIEAIERYDRGTSEWRERAEKITKIYLDQHRTTASPRRFALLWSNIETLKPATYAKLPQAVVSRKFKDADPAGRKAGEILERGINSTFSLYGFDEVMRSVRDDRLIVSRGQAWIRYEAEFEDTGQQDEKGEPVQRVASEHVCHDYVHWTDFGHTLDRTWAEVTLVWRRVYLTKAKATKRFGEDKAKKLNYEVRPQLVGVSGDGKDATKPQAIIYEIWDKEKKKTVWIAKEEKVTLETGEPPLNLRNFFPCPEPVYGTKSTGTLIPTPDYRYYQDQAEEIDDLTQKIASLSEWLILKAFIPSGPSSEGGDAIIKMLQDLTSKVQSKGLFVPVESWAGFTEKGGSKLIDWLPIDLVAKTIQVAIECRQQLINDVYQITGISDILRGESDPNETLGAQQIKAQTGSRRISTIQRDIARFARDLADMSGEVIAEIFQRQTLEEMTGMTLNGAEMPDEQFQAMQQQLQMMQQQASVPTQPGMPPSPPDPRIQQLQEQLKEIELNREVFRVLRDEKTRGFRIEIETDSTVEPDENAEKQSRVEFLEAVGGFMERSQPIVQASPGMAPAIGEMLLFLVRGFRAGRPLEDVIERAMQQVAQTAQQPHENPEVQAEQAKAQAVQQKAQQDMAASQQKHQQDMEAAQQKHVAEMEKLAAQRELMAAEISIERERLGMKEREMNMQIDAKQRMADLESTATERGHEINMEALEAKREAASAS